MTVAQILTEVATFTDAYAVYVTAGLILGLAFWGVRKLIKAGR